MQQQQQIEAVWSVVSATALQHVSCRCRASLPGEIVASCRRSRAVSNDVKLVQLVCGYNVDLACRPLMMMMMTLMLMTGAC